MNRKIFVLLHFCIDLDRLRRSADICLGRIAFDEAGLLAEEAMVMAPRAPMEDVAFRDSDGDASQHQQPDTAANPRNDSSFAPAI